MRALIAKLKKIPINKTSQTLLFFIAFAVTPYLIPGLDRYRALVPESIAGVLKRSRSEQSPHSETASVKTDLNDKESVSDQNASVKIGAKANKTATKIRRVIEAKPGEIEDPSGEALNSFFDSLKKAEEGEGIARVCHYGDSPITSDGITSTVRRNLQLKFGDAGHGFIFIAKPWGWYGHIGVDFEPGSGWRSDPMFISRSDHKYGLGGATFTSKTAGTTASFGTVTDGKVGQSVSSFDIYYLIQPHGGDFEIEIDGRFYENVSTAGDQIQSGFHQVKIEEGPHKMTIKTAGNGEVRLFGVVMESSDRGVEYDSLGVNGAFIGLLNNYMDGDHWIEQLRRRNPNLVILAYGANESEFENLPMNQYQRDTKMVIARIREALPEASIMLIGPMDRGKRGPGGGIITRPTIPRLIEHQRRIAAETGCAFFDAFTAMGGDGTVARWYEARPKLMGGDFTHPTAQGSEIVGSLIYDAIIKAYEEYKNNNLPQSAQKTQRDGF